ncbi:MAG: hypothetical protein Q7T01_01740 [bacterium]|nr:hypothetical protein [bacterium]
MDTELDLIEAFWETVADACSTALDDGEMSPVHTLVTFAVLGASTPMLVGLALVRDCLDGNFRYFTEEEPWDEQPEP